MIDSLEKCLPTAEKCGVVLGLENHWGLGRTPEGVLRIVNAINSPWLRVTLDTGNFLEDPYDRLEMLAPKRPSCRPRPTTAAGSGTRWIWTTRGSPRILRQHRYRGYISLEFEGREDYRTAVPKSLAVLRTAFTF